MARGFLISELSDGGVYECQLSGQPVLIVNEKGKKRGYQYNRVTGKYQMITIKNHQLKYPSK